ncbi:hypothetical protein DFP72DRAFT_969926 [Ephemerocybe angulata]|uniref:F-box domain-containing protein n=1 Tax=Ephemerocybe angulata TaxID=980116 RepID=A0A8H6HMR5_9AGAR|nr:hypothetical protein DFP72DRAFT_969926 [Tulosesus angulatus]
MSLRVGWNDYSPVDEHQDVVMQDAPSWNPTSVVLKAGRGLSGWLFGSSPPVSPTFAPKSYLRYGHPILSDPILGSTPTFLRHEVPSTLINNLPQELLEKIFWEYVHGTTRGGGRSSIPLQGSYRRILSRRGAVTTPISLSHVCSSWRRVVTSYPYLWARLCVSRAESQDIPLLEYWLARSTTCPLDMTVVQRYKGEEEVDPVTIDIISTLARHSSRWRKLSLQLQPNMETPFLSISPGFTLPLLEEFDLNLTTWSAEGSRYISEIMTNGPRIRSGAWNMALQHPGSSYNSLSTIRIGTISLADLIPSLPDMRHLQSLTIDNLDTSYGPSPVILAAAHSPIILPHLMTLALGRYPDASKLFDAVTVPSLTKLSLGLGFGMEIPVETGMSAFSSLVGRSDCCLRSLAWIDSYRSEDGMVRTFSHLSRGVLGSLVHLRVDRPTSDLTLRTLTLNGELPVFPSLRSIELLVCEGSADMLAAMVSSRPALMELHATINNLDLLVDPALFNDYRAIATSRPGLVIDF